MIKLFFKKPFKAILKINNEIITDFMCEVIYTKPILVEYLPYTTDFLPFTELLQVENNKLKTTSRIEITVWNSERFYIGYLPQINNPYELSIEKVTNGFSSGKNINVALIKDNTYHIFIYRNNKIEKVINAPKDIRYPKLDITDDFIIINAKNVYDEKHIIIISLTDYSVLLSKACDVISCEPDGLTLSKTFPDALGRTANYVYDYDNRLKLKELSFDYKYPNADEYISTLFTEAYLACDLPKINEYLMSPINYGDLKDYLGDLQIETDVIGESRADTVNISYKEKNVKIVKRLKFSFIGNKIDTFEII